MIDELGRGDTFGGRLSRHKVSLIRLLAQVTVIPNPFVNDGLRPSSDLDSVVLHMFTRYVSCFYHATVATPAWQGVPDIRPA